MSPIPIPPKAIEHLVVHGLNTMTHSTAVTESEQRNQSIPGTEARATKESTEPQTTLVGLPRTARDSAPRNDIPDSTGRACANAYTQN
jgi:hypothetical protein